MVGRILIKLRAAAENGHRTRIDVLDIFHICKPHHLVAASQGVIFFTRIFLIALQGIVVWGRQGLARAVAERHLHLAGDTVRIANVGPFGHIEVDIDAVRIHTGKEFHRPFKADAEKPYHDHGNDSQKGHDQDRHPMVQRAVQKPAVRFQHGAADGDGRLAGPFDFFDRYPCHGHALSQGQFEKYGCHGRIDHHGHEKR